MQALVLTFCSFVANFNTEVKLNQGEQNGFKTSR